MNFSSRIQLTPTAVSYVDLTESEDKLYRGSGEAWAEVDGRNIISVQYKKHGQRMPRTSNELWWGIMSGFRLTRPIKLHSAKSDDNLISNELELSA